MSARLARPVKLFQLLCLVVLAGCQRYDHWTNSSQDLYMDQYIARCRNIVVAQPTTKAASKRSETLHADILGAPDMPGQYYDFELSNARTIRGRLKPGNLTVMGPEDPNATRGLTPLRGGYTKPSIWVLSPACTTATPSGPLYPLAFITLGLNEEPFVRAVCVDELAQNFRDLFKSDSATKIRAMYFISGGSFGGVYRYSLRHGFEHEVQGAMHDRDPIVRQVAILALDRLTGSESTGLFRAMLTDQDPKVRSTAAAVLIERRDTSSLPQIKPIFGAMKVEPMPQGDKILMAEPIEPLLISLDSMSQWKNIDLVPMLISKVDDTQATPDPVFPMNHVSNIPAISAAQTLKEITGCSFPNDAELAASLWARAQQSSNPKESLRKLLAPYEVELKASVVRSPSGTETVQVRNNSKSSIWLSKEPTSVVDGYPISYGVLGLRKLEPGGTMNCYVNGLTSLPRTRVKLQFKELPTDKRKRGWVGELAVQP